VYQLEIKVLNIVVARCNHEALPLLARQQLSPVREFLIRQNYWEDHLTV